MSAQAIGRQPPAPRSRAGTTAPDPVGKQPRTCADRDRLCLCRHSLRAGLTGVFAGLQGPRETEGDRRDPEAGRPLRRRWRGLCAGLRRRRGRRAGGDQLPERDRRGNDLRGTPGGRSPRRIGRPGRPHRRHGGEVPLHLRLHRVAEGGDQHQPHDHGEPGDDPGLLPVPDPEAAGRSGLGALEPYGGGGTRSPISVSPMAGPITSTTAGPCPASSTRRSGT